MKNKYHHHISNVIAKFITGKITGNESVELDNWRKKKSNDLLLKQIVKDCHKEPIDLEIEADYNKVITRCKVQQKNNNRKRILYRIIPIAAASISIIFASYFLITSKSTDNNVSNNAVNDDVELVLSSGNVVKLANHSADTLVDNKTILTTQRNNIKYSKSEKRKAKTKYNTLKVPRQKQYALELSDGTKVWLNSDSEITYPIAFNGKTRHVKVKGEICFDVAENSDCPFIVELDHMMIKVLGTIFNVRNYDENSITTLVEGHVQIISKQQQFGLLQLIPNEQIEIDVSNQQIIKRHVIAHDFVDWRKGIFVFKHQPLQLIMEELERIYDVDVHYENDDLRNVIITGEINRNQSIKTFIEYLTKIDAAKFEISNKRIVVSDK